MKKNLIRILIGKVLLLCFVIVPFLHAADFTGKRIEWTIPFSESGGSAKWANFFAPLLSEALP